MFVLFRGWPVRGRLRSRAGGRRLTTKYNPAASKRARALKGRGSAEATPSGGGEGPFPPRCLAADVAGHGLLRRTRRECFILNVVDQ